MISAVNDFVQAALYIRLSREDDTRMESQSVKNQRTLLRDFAEKNSFTVYGEYVDDGYSGAQFDRPAFLRLLADIEAKRVNLVITKDLSRLGRDYIQTGYYLETYFPEKGVRYISILDGIDSSKETAMDDITPFKSILNDMYAKDISKKIKSVKQDKQKKGLFIGPKAPYGYQVSEAEKNKLELDEEAACVVRKIFQYALLGKGCAQIAELLNAEHVPPPAVYALQKKAGGRRQQDKERLWRPERILYMLKNRVYAGDMVQGRVKRLSYKTKKSRRLPPEEWAVVAHMHEPAVDQETFDSVQSILNKRSRVRRCRYDDVWKGLLICHECGRPLSLIRRRLAGNREQVYVTCRAYQRQPGQKPCLPHMAPLEEVAELVQKEMRREMLEAAAFEDFVSEASLEAAHRQAAKKTKLEAVNLQEQYQALLERMDGVYQDYSCGLLLREDFVRLYEKMKAQREALLFKLREAENTEQKDTSVEAEPGRAVEHFFDTIAENRELLYKAVAKIELTQEMEVLLYFQFHKQ